MQRTLFKFIYKLSSFFGRPIYERYLYNEVKRGKVPKHIGIILDGNRRYAIEKGKEPWWGHYRGAEKLKETLEWCLELGIRNVTVYAFSTENSGRSKKEVENLFKLFIEKLKEASEDERIHRNKVRIKIFGKREYLPNDLKEAIKEAEEKTKDYSNYLLGICLLYGGRQEIVDAVKRIALSVKQGRIEPEEISEKVIEENLYTQGMPDPDLIIRTSGEERLSNFLLWQSAYSELYFCETYFPEFRKIDFLRAIRDYQRRKRRFGK